MTPLRSSTIDNPRNPFAVFMTAWDHRVLIFRLVRREIESRFKGSYLGLLWAVIVPLLLLGVYTFVFSVIFQARWDAGIDNKGFFALVLFAGLILFNVFAECIGRAPALMLSNVTYIKKVVFPLEVLPWVVLFSALFNAAISFVVLGIGYVLIMGIPPVTILLFPLILLPLTLFTLGLSLILSSIGVFLRDLQQFIGIAVMIVMFLSPIFYPISAIPEQYRYLIQLNPLASIVESAREAIFFGKPPALIPFLIYTFVAWNVAWFGHWWFMKTKKAFADVV